jgi:hypothetical protein
MPAVIDQSGVAKRYGETSAENVAQLDFANDGKAAPVALLSLSSGAGAGCDETFFDVLSDSGKSLDDGPSHQLIAALQNLDDSPYTRYPVLPCGNSPRFFRYRGQIFFENTWPPLDTWHERHDVRRVVNGHAEDVCGITFLEHTAPVAETPASPNNPKE